LGDGSGLAAPFGLSLDLSPRLVGVSLGAMRYVHTNLIVRDVERALAFYRDVFGCVPVPPARELSGDWLARGTAVPAAALRGMHLRLPGQPEDGATLEIYTYADVVAADPPAANRLGFGHLAFEVDDVEGMVDRVAAGGGTALGEIVTHVVDGVGELTFTYARDPEGNILELQRWDRQEMREVDSREFYDAWAADYDEATNPTRDLASQVLRAMLPDLSGVSVLELGCGSGRNTEALASAKEVVAVDFSPGMLRRARSAVDVAHVRFVEHDLREPLSFVASQSMDVVVISLVLEHLRDIASVYREVGRVLRPGGQALVLELHPARQQLGKRARFEQGDSVVAAPAFLHTISEHVRSGLEVGLTLVDIGEHGPAGGLPRVLALALRR